MNRMAMALGCLGCAAFLLGMASLAWAQGKKTPTGSPTSAPGELRERDGQPVQGNPGRRWEYAEVTVEWGFRKGAEKLAFDGSIESTHLLGALGTARPLPEDKATTMAGERAWKSPAGKGARRGIVVPVLFTDAVRGPGRTIVTGRRRCEACAGGLCARRCDELDRPDPAAGLRPVPRAGVRSGRGVGAGWEVSRPGGASAKGAGFENAATKGR